MSFGRHGGAWAESRGRFAHMASGSRGGAWPLSPFSVRGSVGMSTRRARTERPRLNKALGQHLLVSDGVLDDIIEAAELSVDDVVVEVGPGTGLLTRRLLGAAGQVVAVEIDPAMVAHIRETLSDNENLTLVEGDIREQRPEGLTDGKPYIVVANLPYYVASPTIRLFLEADHPPRRMVVMVQREVAQQMTAAPGKASLLTLATQVYSDVKIVRRVRPGSFVPAPGVESAVVRLDVLAEPRVAREMLGSYFKVARAGFSAPRKQLRNSLANGLAETPNVVDGMLTAAGIDGRRRAETLTIDEWGRIATELERQAEHVGGNDA